MEYLLLSFVLAIVFAYLAYPVIKPPHAETLEPNTRTRDALVAERDFAYQAIRDLDFDFQLGKLSPADYQTLRDKHKANAATVLQQLDTLAPATPAETTPTPARDASLFCTNCGTRRAPDDKFCRKCGNRLK